MPKFDKTIYVWEKDGRHHIFGQFICGHNQCISSRSKDKSLLEFGSDYTDSIISSMQADPNSSNLCFSVLASAKRFGEAWVSVPPW